MAGRGLASPGVAPRWLPTWLPELVSAANVRSSGLPGYAGTAAIAEPGQQDRLWQTTGRDETGVDPGSSGQCPQAAGTGGEDVITAGGRAHHGGINRIAAAAAGQQHSRPAAMAVMTSVTRFAGRPAPSTADAGA